MPSHTVIIEMCRGQANGKVYLYFTTPYSAFWISEIKVEVMLVAVVMETEGVVAVKYTGQDINGRRQYVVPRAVPPLELVKSIE